MEISSSPSPQPLQRSDRPLPGEGPDVGKADPAKKANGSAQDPKVQAEIQNLKRRDQEVKAHEAAHAATGGAYVRGGPSFQYTTGPDGKRYAVGGEVQIDMSAVAGDPSATAAKMRVVRSAALAPANPSGQDLRVAAQATQVEAQARLEAALTARAAVTATKVPTTKGGRVDRYG